MALTNSSESDSADALVVCPHCGGHKVLFTYTVDVEVTGAPFRLSKREEICGMCAGVGSVSLSARVEYQLKHPVKSAADKFRVPIY